MTDKFCSRSGCTKKLRPTNTTGMCATGCLSPDAMPSQRQVGNRGPGRGEASSVMKRFRVVATALGKDPNAILDEAAQGWLDAVMKAVE